MRHKKTFICVLFVIIFFSRFSYAEENVKDNRIVVFPQKEKGTFNKLIFGNNLIGYDPASYENWTKKYFGFSNFGSGIWDPKYKEPVAAVIDLMKNIKISALRFPGGCGTHHYDWKKTVGKRKSFLFGLDEFLKVCKTVNAEPVITISYFTGDEFDAADLVEYLNARNDGTNHNGGVDWAKERAKNGHPQSYQVKYFEIGNEVYHGDHRKIKKVKSSEYAYNYLKYYGLLKTVDPNIKIGTVLSNDHWDKEVMKIIKGKIDFGVTHFYFSSGWAHKDLDGKDIKDIKKIFFDTIYEPNFFKKTIQKKLKILKRFSGRDIPLVFSEYNTAFHQNKPVALRHSLGAALVNAQILKVIMQPENNILMANYWNLCNEFWGMIANGFKGNYKTLYKPYYKRPNYYAFELYTKSFGNRLIDYKCDEKLLMYLSVNASENYDLSKVYLMVINRNMDESVRATVEIKDFVPSSKVTLKILTGPSICSTNETKHNNVKVIEDEINIIGNQFEYSFKPHSLTAIEIERKQK